MEIEIIKTVRLVASSLKDPGDGDARISYNIDEIVLNVGYTTEDVVVYADAPNDVYLLTADGSRVKLRKDEYKITKQDA